MDVDHNKYENLVLIIKGRLNVPSSVKPFRHYYIFENSNVKM